MQTPLSPADAEHALHSIELSRLAMRKAIRAHRGHFHLWLWGATWIGMALTVHFQGVGESNSCRFSLWQALLGRR